MNRQTLYLSSELREMVQVLLSFSEVVFSLQNMQIFVQDFGIKTVFMLSCF